MSTRVYLNMDMEKMKTIQRKVHNYLGMTFDYSVKRQVKIKMMDYIKEIMKCFDKAESVCC